MRVYKGELTDEEHADSMATYFYDLPTTAKRRNKYVHASAKAGDLRIFSLPDLIEANGLKSTPGAFVYPGEYLIGPWMLTSTNTFAAADSHQVPLTTYVVADFDSDEGVEFIKEALTSMVTLFIRLTFVVIRLSFDFRCRAQTR